MEMFWLVWCVNRGLPNVQHPTYESACIEAERLARANPGFRFEVMERVSSVAKQEVQWEGRAPELGMPF